MIQVQRCPFEQLEDILNELQNNGYEILFVTSDYHGCSLQGYTIIYRLN